MKNEISALNLLKSIYPSLSKKEKKVAEFILKNTQKAIYLSITELSDLCKAGEATIIRLAQKLGYSGYQELKLALARDLVSPDLDLLEEVRPEDDLSTLIQKVRARNIKAINDTTNILDLESLSKAIDSIVNARKVEFYGVGASGFTALDAKYKFLRIGILCDAFTDPHLQAMSAACLTPKDVAVGISHSGATRDTIDSLKVAKNTGAKTICITNFMRSPITEVADIVLLTSSPETPLTSGAIRSKIAQLHIIDLLFTGVAMRIAKKAGDYTEKTAKAVLNKLY